MQPTSSTTIQRPDLGAIAFEYMTDPTNGFIGLQLMPIFEVPEKSADYPKIPFETILKVPVTSRAPDGGYRRQDWEFETGTYACTEDGWEERVDDSDANNYARFFNAEEIATIRATNVLLRSLEKRHAAAIFNTSNITGTAAVTTEWDTSASCTPYADIQAGKTAMRAASGLEPNVVAMGKKAFDNAFLSSEVRSRLQYTAPIEMMPVEARKRMLATYFGVDRVLVGEGIYDAAKYGQSASITDIWDDEYVLLAKVSMSQDLREPALGRTMLWTPDSPSILTVEQYRDEKVRSNIIRVRHSLDHDAFTFTGAGYLLSNITT